MAKLLSALPVGSVVKSTNTKYNGKVIRWIVGTQDTAVRPVLSVVPRHEIFQAVKSEVRSFAFLACVVVVYESFRKVRFQDIIAKTVLNDFVAEAVIHDQSFLRFFHNEAVIRRQAVFVGR